MLLVFMHFYHNHVAHNSAKQFYKMYNSTTKKTFGLTKAIIGLGVHVCLNNKNLNSLFLLQVILLWWKEKALKL